MELVQIYFTNFNKITIITGTGTNFLAFFLLIFFPLATESESRSENVCRSLRIQIHIPDFFYGTILCFYHPEAYRYCISRSISSWIRTASISLRIQKVSHNANPDPHHWFFNNVNY